MILRNHRLRINTFVFSIFLCLISGFSFLPGPACADAETVQAEKMPPADIFFKIKVIDEETGRGVPQIELRTVNKIRYYTDSNGIVAFYEPGLMNKQVFFTLKSHGYEYPEDFLGFRGKKLMTIQGGSVVLKIKRLNVAERLYRITGAGIYRDSLLVGEPVPLRHPLVNAQVLGQDSILQELYRGKLFHIWGDTDRYSYPLGLFASSGATSELPGRGGLDPDVGVNLDYYLADDGFSRKMAPFEEKGMIWLDSLMTVYDDAGKEILVSRFSRMKSLGEKSEQGFMVFDDKAGIFKKVKSFPVNEPAIPGVHPSRVLIDGSEWLYFSNPFHTGVTMRVPATYEAAMDLDSYEMLFPAGDTDRPGAVRIARWQSRKDVRENQPKVWKSIQENWQSMKRTRPVINIEFGDKVRPHNGTIYWNSFRNRWVMIMQESGGKTSLLGEIWYAEADTIAGPWIYGRKVVTHDDYSLYNVKHNPFYDKEDGRFVYFEGTYVNTFTDTQVPTPRYDYNQMMYRLTLDDPRLFLPAPVYKVKDSRGDTGFLMRDEIQDKGLWSGVESVPFLACPPDRRREGTVPIWKVISEKGDLPSARLALATKDGQKAMPFFYALPADTEPDENSRKILVPLYERKNPQTGMYEYKTGSMADTIDEMNGRKLLCYVWKNPRPIVTLDPEPKPWPGFKN